MKRGVLLLCALLLAIYSIGFWGCTREIEGPERINQPPIVDFVNIPVTGAKFSSDTTIYWYGTDVDGFIRYFRYAVIESTVVGSNPKQFITDNKSGVDWVVLEVTLNNPNSKSEIKMSADIKDPVRKFVASYVFLQAIDNLGAESEIVYRLFRKNNHFPVTAIHYRDIFDPFINAKTSGGVLEGVRMTWSAEDPIDYPRDAPPFEYRWRLYGPYDTLQMSEIRDRYQKEVFVDGFGDYYLHGDILQRIISADTAIDNTVTPPETTITPIYEYIDVDTLPFSNPYGSWDTVLLGVFPEIDSAMLPEDSLPILSELDLVDPPFLVEASQGWLYGQERANVFDVFRKDTSPPETLAITRKRYFFFSCQARDDSKVPDVAPDFRWISIIEPKFERDVILLDLTSYKRFTFFMNWPHYPVDPFYRPTDFANGFEPDQTLMVRRVYSEFVNNWKPNSFDAENVLPNITVITDDLGTVDRVNYQGFQATQDYYPIALLKSFPAIGVGSIQLTDVMRHKIVIMAKDDVTSAMNFGPTAYEAGHVKKGLSAGMSAWAMLRSPFQSGAINFTFPFTQPVPEAYKEYFGIEQMWHTGWTGFIGLQATLPPGTLIPRLEDFVGAAALPGTGLPNIKVDSAFLVDRFLWEPNTPYQKYLPYPFIDTLPCYPEVGFIEKNGNAVALYLYESKYGNSPPSYLPRYQGRVVASRYETQVFRTAHCSFGLIAMDSVTAQQVFNEMMDWLSDQPLLETGRVASNARAQVSIQKLRDMERETEELRRMGLMAPMVQEY
ncbi:MAG: hypothetical protein JSV44_08050 [Candidatus Zixiibacteriota bacterium]|nr:MAG: hypothetical protein JSV44_08050 [candidate division Zixibacteria bacterium]